jgi:alkylated DNA repair dioxygenase AlkB
VQSELFVQPLTVKRDSVDLVYWPQWLSQPEQDRLWRAFEQLAWEQSIIKMMGRQIPVPRLNTWYGDSDEGYGYSGIRLKINPWTKELLEVRDRVKEHTDRPFNSVLANWYRNGQESVDWHADDEPELGKSPIIATVSLGGPRKFVLKHRSNKTIEPIEFNLAPGSLLLMQGATQTHWVHKIPKTRRPVEPRISLTYRNVIRLS